MQIQGDKFNAQRMGNEQQSVSEVKLPKLKKVDDGSKDISLSK